METAQYYATRLVFRASSSPIPGCEYYSTLPPSITTRYGSDSLLYVCLIFIYAILSTNNHNATQSYVTDINATHNRRLAN